VQCLVALCSGLQYVGKKKNAKLLVGNTISVGTPIAFLRSRFQRYHLEGIVIRFDRRGFTLFELLTVIVLMGIVLAVAYPRMSSMATSASVRTARGAMITAVNVAKSSAVTSGKCSYLRLTTSSVTVFTTPCEGGTQINIVSNRNFNADYGVSLTLTKGSGSALTSDSLGFDPRGIPLNTQVTSVFTITKNGVTRSVTVGKYGRIQ
jgi:prepilin-type N-terminal cleavage/methylation domain-containing protein